MDTVATVQEYYGRIDAGDINWVIKLFADHGTYDRAGSIYRGRSAIRDFYEHQRKVRLTHYNLQFWRVAHHVFVEGAFVGWGSDNSPRHGEFADHWIFDHEGCITYRRTSLYAGADFIRI